jgi:hypothetical protein
MATTNTLIGLAEKKMVDAYKVRTGDSLLKTVNASVRLFMRKKKEGLK